MSRILFIAPVSGFHGEGNVTRLLYEDLVKSNSNLVTLLDVNTIGFSFIKRLALYLYCLMRLCLICLLKKHDVIYISPSRSILGMVRESLFLLLNRTPSIIFHVHGAILKDVYNKHFIGKFLFLLYSKRDLKVVGLSSGHKNYIPNFPGAQYYSIGNPVDESIKFTENRSFISYPDIRFGFLSNPDSQKGLKQAVDYLHEIIPFYSLSVAGWSEDDFLSVYGEEPPPNLIFKGRVIAKEKVDFFDSIDVLVYLSLNDAQPLAVLEALGSGVIVVISEVMFLGDLLIFKNCYSLHQFKVMLNESKKIPIYNDYEFYKAHSREHFLQSFHKLFGL